jgi:hypothetical protein
MGTNEYELKMEEYGEVLSSKLNDVGYDITFNNESGNIDIFHQLYIECLSDEFIIANQSEEPNYYKAYFLRKK